MSRPDTATPLMILDFVDVMILNFFFNLGFPCPVRPPPQSLSLYKGVIPHNAPANIFLQDWSVTFFLDTYKNCVRGASTIMEGTNLKHEEPISAVAWRFLHLLQHNSDPDTTIS